MLRNIWWIVFCAGVVAHCAPSTGNTVDLKKARVSLKLANGQTISQNNVDDYNPQLIATDDGTLILLFGSNRTCGTCTASNYYVFVSTSVAPYEFAEIPAFNTPVVMNNAGSAISLGTTRGNFNAFWTQNKISVVFDQGANIKIANITAANVATANTAGSPANIANTSRNGDKLLMVNSKDLTMLSVTGGVVRKSAVFFNDSGVVQTNSKLATAGSATLAHYAYTGYTDAVFYPDNGQLSSGLFSDDLDSHEIFNDALTSSGLSLNYITTLRTPFPILDIAIFSAQSTPGTSAAAQRTSDLYASSQPVAFLYLATGTLGPLVPIYDDVDDNYPPYRMFVSSAAETGDFGGAPVADVICQYDTAVPDKNVTYKAMLVDGLFRSAPASFDIDWVLQPFESYIRGDTGVLIQTADGGAEFPFNLNANLSSGTVWTGLDNAWADDSVDNCGGWFSSGPNGAIGDSSSTTDTSISDGTQVCSSPAKFYCIEQPTSGF